MSGFCGILQLDDATGNTGLYYWQDGRRRLFASSIAALLAHPAAIARPHAWTVAWGLMTIGDPNHTDDTAYEGIRLLNGGHMLAVDAGRRCWRPRCWRAVWAMVCFYCNSDAIYKIFRID